VKEIVKAGDKVKKISVTPKTLNDYPGVPKYRYGETGDRGPGRRRPPASPGPRSAASF
jgi:hypothetical protein